MVLVGISWRYLGNIFGISWGILLEYLWDILGVFWAYIGDVLVKLSKNGLNGLKWFENGLKVV